MNFFEDDIPNEILDAISATLSCQSDLFTDLVAAAQLDKASDLINSNLDGVDLRGSDLRGYNFTGCSLVGAIVDETTLIDETTIFDQAVVDFIEKQRIPIVDQMMRVSTASSSSQRRRELELLFEQYDSPQLATFVRNEALRTRSFQHFVDLADFIQPEQFTKSSRLLESFCKVARREMKSRKRNSKQEGRGDLRANSILYRCKESSNSFLNSFASRVEKSPQGLVQGLFSEISDLE